MTSYVPNRLQAGRHWNKHTNSFMENVCTSKELCVRDSGSHGLDIVQVKSDHQIFTLNSSWLRVDCLYQILFGVFTVKVNFRKHIFSIFKADS